MSTAFELGKQVDEKRFEPILSRRYLVKAADYLSEGWDLFKQRPWEFIGFTALFFLVNFALAFVPFAGPLLVTPLAAGFFYVAFQMQRGRSVEFADFLRGFNYWLPLVLSSFLIGALTAIGFLLLIVPGIYLAVAYTFSFPLIVDKGMFFWQAMEVSRKVVTRRWFGIFGFALLLGLVNLVGAAIFLVGLLVSVPWTFCAIAAAYKDIIGLEPLEAQEIEKAAA